MKKFKLPKKLLNSSILQGSTLYLTYAKNITQPKPLHDYKRHAYKKTTYF